jgi:ABC-type Mn2+/Zn2+ transport system permease subunit
MMALGIMLFSFQKDSSANLINFLFGNILLLENFDLIVLVLMAIAIMLTVTLLFKKWIYFIFDPIGACLKGISISFYHYLLFIIMTITIVTAVKLAGSILVTTLLIMPGVFAIQTQKSVKNVFWASTIFALTTTIFGLTVANWLNTPSGATLCLIQFVTLNLLFLKNRLAP